MNLIILLLLLILIVGVMPAWPHSRGWGYYPSGGLSVALAIVLLLYFFGGI